MQFICFHKSVWEPNHRAPGTYTVNHAYVIKFIKMTSNSKDRAVKKHRKHGKTKQYFSESRDIKYINRYINLDKYRLI